jgi:2-dehydropantoate 2-reductase
MDITFFGPGAIGGNFAARIANAGHSVSLIARGENLTAIRANGLELRSGDTHLKTRPRVTDNPADLGPQSLIITTVKATAPGQLAAGLKPLIGPYTRIVFAQNGIPWWYNLDATSSPGHDADLSFLDPDGALRSLVPMERVIGGVISSSNEVIAPGVVHNISPDRNRLHLGRPDDKDDQGLAELRETLVAAGIESPLITNIREAIWGKLTLNISSSLISLITGHDLTILVEDERLGGLAMAAAAESIAIASALGMETGDIDPEQLRRNPTPHMPSLRQDYDRQRSLELDCLLLAPLALARSLNVATPVLNTLAALAVHTGKQAGLYSDAVN